uniref:Methyltransferase-like protein 7A n=1 Tax=Hirondellea gigas TaxID=1518452 RepID=A0A2P2I129_9CRUS
MELLATMISYIVTFALGFVFCKLLPDLKFRFHAFVKVKLMSNPQPLYFAFKEELLGKIKNVKSKFPEHQKTNSIRILEVGVGIGTNFKFYPDGCHLVVVDPNPHWEQYYNSNRSKFPQIKSQDIIVAYGEDMYMVPDESVDVVVITKVMCSVRNIKKMLQQVRRVLVTGGKLFFIEHIREWDAKNHGYRLFLQDFLSLLRIWPNMFSGCELNRETLKDVEAAGFSSVEAEKKHAPITHPIFQISGSQVVGIATK